MTTNAPRELTPADARVLEPDLLGALSLVLHGRTEPERAPPSGPSRTPAGWRGRGRQRRQNF